MSSAHPSRMKAADSSKSSAWPYSHRARSARKSLGTWPSAQPAEAHVDRLHLREIFAQRCGSCLGRCGGAARNCTEQARNYLELGAWSDDPVRAATEFLDDLITFSPPLGSVSPGAEPDLARLDYDDEAMWEAMASDKPWIDGEP